MRESARQEKEARIAAATETFYEKVEAVEHLAEQIVQAEASRDQTLVTLAGEGLNPKEIATLTGLEQKTIRTVLKAAKPASAPKGSAGSTRETNQHAPDAHAATTTESQRVEAAA